MAVYTTLFIATDKEITATFPDARRRLDIPIQRTGVDPFLGGYRQFTTWDPGMPGGVEPITFAETYGRKTFDPLIVPDDES